MDFTHAEAAAAAIASEVSRIRALLRQQKFPEALAAGEALLAESPAHRDVLLCRAIAQRCLTRIPEGLQTLALLERHHPRFSRLYEERGRCYVELRQATPAIEAFQAAVNINHALPVSWGMLEGLYRMTGQTDNAATAASHVARLRKVPQEIVLGTGVFSAE